MNEVSARCIFLGQCHNVVLNTCRERTGAEGETVVGIIHCREEPLDVLVAVDDTGQSEHGDWRVVGMHAHIDAGFLAHGHDGLEEILHVLAQLLLVDTLVEVEELAEELYRVLVVLLEISAHEALSLYHYVLHQFVVLLGSHRLGELIGFGKHVATLKLVEISPLLACALALEDVNVEICKLGIREIEVARTVGVLVQQVGARPVEHGHEIIADALDALGSEIAHRLLIYLNLMVAVGTAIFDGLHHGQAFHHAPSHSVLLDILPKVADFFACPHFAERYVVQGCHYALHSDLLQHGKGDLVVLAKPSPGSFHNLFFCFILVFCNQYNDFLCKDNK